MLSADPFFRKLTWLGVAERRMETFPVVERLDVIEQIGLRLGPRSVAGAMHPLIFQAIEEVAWDEDILMNMLGVKPL
jgi:hypothetical protein